VAREPLPRFLQRPGDGSLTSVSDSRRMYDRYQSYILPLGRRPVIRTNRSYTRWRDFQMFSSRTANGHARLD